MRFFTSLILFLLVLFSGLLPNGANAESDANINLYNEALDKIAERFVKLSKAGGIIDQPKLPEEFYHNAKIYEMRGDLINARNSYEYYVQYNLQFIDPVYDYINILTLQEHPEKVESIIKSLQIKAPSPTLSTLIAVLQRDKEKRIKLLEAVIAKYPKYGPAYFEMANEFSEIKIGRQGISDKQKEKIHLGKFIELSKEGNVYKDYLDKRIFVSAMREAERRHELLRGVPTDNNKQIEHFFQKNSCIGTVFIKPPEEVKDIYYSFDNYKYISTGHFPGNGVLNQNIELLIKSKPYILYVKYRDIQNNVVGPFEIKVDNIINSEDEDHTYCINLKESEIKLEKKIIAFYSSADSSWAKSSDFLNEIKSDGRFVEINSGSVIKLLYSIGEATKFEYQGNQYWTTNKLD